MFERKGLTANQMVVLSGARTIESASCVTFDHRIQTLKPDSTLNPRFVRYLKHQCPTPVLFYRVFMDSTFNKFNSQYFHDFICNRGLMSSDPALMEDHRTRRSVYAYRNPTAFSKNFARAMVAISKIGMLTSHQSEIQQHMSVVNRH